MVSPTSQGYDKFISLNFALLTFSSKVDVHDMIFDPKARAGRRLEELEQMMVNDKNFVHFSLTFSSEANIINFILI